MAHLLIIVLLIVFVPIALATLEPVLTPVLKTAGMLIFGPVFAVWLIISGLHRAPGAIYRGCRSFVVTGGAKEFMRAVAICAVATLLMLPFFQL